MKGGQTNCEHWETEDKQNVAWRSLNNAFQPVSGIKAKNVNFQARSQTCEKRLLASPCLSAWNISAPTGRIFMKFDI